jgi:hypothetical protein
MQTVPVGTITPKEETYTNNQSQDLDEEIFLHVMSPYDDCCGFIPYITQNFDLRSAPKIVPKIARTGRKPLEGHSPYPVGF